MLITSRSAYQQASCLTDHHQGGSANVGVECGQLTVIAAAFLVIGLPFRRKPWYRQRIVIPGSLLIAAVGLFWFVQRVMWV